MSLAAAALAVETAINLRLVAVVAVAAAKLLVMASIDIWHWIRYMLMSEGERAAEEYGGTANEHDYSVDDERLP